MPWLYDAARWLHRFAQRAGVFGDINSVAHRA